MSGAIRLNCVKRKCIKQICIHGYNRNVWILVIYEYVELLFEACFSDLTTYAYLPLFTSSWKYARIFWSSWKIHSKRLIRWQLETISKVIVFPVPKNLFHFRTILSLRRAKLHGCVGRRAPTGSRKLTTANHKTVLNTWEVSFCSNKVSTKKTWNIQSWGYDVHSGFRVGHIFLGTCCRVPGPVKYGRKRVDCFYPLVGPA